MRRRVKKLTKNVNTIFLKIKIGVVGDLLDRVLRFENVADGEAQLQKRKRFQEDPIDVFRRFIRRMTGDENDGLGAQALFDGGGELVSFHPRHSIIGEHEIKVFCIKASETVFATRRSVHVVAILEEHGSDHLTNQWLIIHH